MGSLDVTLRTLSLGSRDATTGWRAKTFTESTIECLEFSRGAHDRYLGVGVYAAEDKMFLTADPVNLYDQLEPRSGEYYLVKTVKKHYGPTPDNFLFRDLQCSSLPLWQATPASATWKTSPDDPRYRTKDYIDGITNPAQGIRDAQITKDDGVTQASWACIFSNPPYPMGLEYRAPGSPVQGLYVVGQPDSTPFIDSDQSPYGYEEQVPVDIFTIDSVGCAGDPLSWKMEAEWRYVTETYLTGSQRALETRRGETVELGSFQLYHIPTVLNYRRDTT